MSAWPDRYRPDDLESMALAPELRQRFEWFLSHGLPRHIILYGPPGCGKTTVVRLIRHQYDDLGVLSVKATETGNVDFIRRQVLGFMQSMMADRKLVIFEEASGLSRDAMEVLRDPLERFADDCRVIFITNDPDKLDEAVKSRCDVIELTRPPVQECARVLERVLAAEGFTVDPATVLAFTRAHFSEDAGRDMRSLLSTAQQYAETTGQLPVPPQAAPSPELMMEVWQSQSRSGAAPDGAQLLNNLVAQFSKYVSLPTGGAETLALWTVFAWAHEAFSISPTLTLLSPTMRAGKTTVLDMLEQLLLPENTYHPSSITPAVLYRLKGIAEPDQTFPATEPKWPTLCLLLDEADLLKWKRDLRAVLDSGHTRKTAYVHRMIAGGGVGKFSSWYPKALAYIERPRSPLPDTIRDRSIIIPMQRMRRGETRPKFPRHQTVPELAELRGTVMSWVTGHFTDLRDLSSGPILAADELHDRAKDNWHPVMCIARVAGGDWEKRARLASMILSDETGEKEHLVQLLTDIRAVFDSEGTDTVGSVALVAALVALEESPWKERRLTPIRLANLLRSLRIRSQQLNTIDPGLGRQKNRTVYYRSQFEDAFARHLD